MNVMIYTIWPQEIGNHVGIGPGMFAPFSRSAGSPGGGGLVQMTCLQAIGTDQG